MYPEIDYSKCKFCKICVNVCGYDVFVVCNDKVIPENKESCIECGECIRNCEENAIKLIE